MDRIDTVDLGYFSESCRIVLSQLSSDELRSSLFLLLEFYEPEKSLVERADKYSKLIQFSENLIDIIHEICVKNIYLLNDLLMTLRNYKLLKKIGSCKHRVNEDYNSISQFWRLLYQVCEDIDDTELEVLKGSFLEVCRQAVCMEQLICILFRHEKIFLGNVSVLIKALQKIDKVELCEKLTNFCREMVEKYHIPIPKKDSPCGVAIIINEIEFHDCQELKLKKREGSHFDTKRLTDLWQYFGLEVRKYENQTAEEICTVFQDFVKQVPQYCHVFIACFLSHGTKDFIYSSDSKPLKIDHFINLVANDCPFLNNKPKVFVIQACQGQKRQHGAAVYSESSDPHSSFETDAVCVPNAPECGDVFQAIATVPGYVSYRKIDEGSLFVIEFTKLMKKFGHTEDIEITMKRVKTNLSEHEHIQMALSKSTLRKTLIFEPLL